jgi:flagellar biosynthesis protein FlhF
MNLQTFKAPTMALGLAQVKHTMGAGAVILHTRTYYERIWMGLRRREVVEITAGRGLNVPDRRRPAPAAPAVAPARQQVSVYPSARAARPGQALLETPAASNAIAVGLTKEVLEVKELVKELFSSVRQQAKPQVPEELFEHYLQLIQNQVAEELALDIVKNIQKQIRPEHMRNAEFIQEKLAEQLEKLIPVAGPIARTKVSGPHVVALIGPTGVGKTTTIAKLAANLKLREKRRVGLITLDTYRIAATEQLKRYADIIGAPLRVVGNVDDLRGAIESMSECEFILIDTAGRSPRDALKISELKNFLEAARADEVHLVLSTTANQECIELAIDKFGEVRCDKIIFTKLDEAAHVGVVLNVVRRMSKALSYVTTGQDVPDDIEVGRGKRLAQLILGNSL